MKKITTLLFTILISTLGFGQQWFEQTTPTNISVAGIHFLDPNFGVATGTGFALRTIDGGLNWTQQPCNCTQHMADAQLTSANIGYAIGNGGEMIKTIDGGLSWNPINSGTTVTLRGLHFLNDTLGFWCGQSQKIGKTTDGGSTWSVLDYGAWWMRELDFPTFNIGYCAGDNGNIYKTINNGQSWSAQSSGTTEVLWEIMFVSADTGYASGNNGTVLKTTNGGNNWNSLNVGTNVNLSALHFVDADNGYVAGDNGTILRTYDGGQNWVNETTDTIINLRRIFMVNNSVGYIAANAGVIFKKTNCVLPTAGFTADTSGGLSVQFTDTSASATGWQWDFGDLSQSTAQNPLHVYPDTGWYYVCLIITDSCGSDTLCDSIYVSPATGIREYAQQQFSIYPNPTTGIFTVQNTEGEIQVHDVFGRLVLTTNKPQTMPTGRQVDLSAYASGIYFVKVGEAVRKLVKH